jgi:hypothetical protein
MVDEEEVEESKKEGDKDFSKKQALRKADLETALIDNFVNLQKVLTNLAIKFDELSTNTSKLLQLFEISARNFAEKCDSGQLNQNSGVDKDLADKINLLLDQNRVLAKGIMVIEDRIRTKNETQNSNLPTQTFPQSQMDRRPSEGGIGGMARPRPFPKY